MNTNLYVWESLWTVLGMFGFIGWFMLDSKNQYSFFPGSIMTSRILQTNVDIISNKQITQWAVEHAQDDNRSSILSRHWWYESLPKEIQDRFQQTILHPKIEWMFRRLFSKSQYTIEPIYDMNELYIAGDDQKDKVHSDNVFYIPHIDGPFSFLPYVSVYRCLIALNPNDHISTRFPMCDKEVTLTTGDVLAFDFNREIHYIEKIRASEDPRIVLKAHYCIYPNEWVYIGTIVKYCNIWYNGLFRKLFLHSIEPVHFLETISSYAVVYGTHIFVWSDMYVGHKNFTYTMILYSMYLSGQINVKTLSYWFYGTALYKHVSILAYLKDLEHIETISYMRDILLYCALGMTTRFVLT